jgi:phosphatidylglycerophosphate synthase
MVRFSISQIRQITFKKENNIWNVFFTEPIALRVLWVVGNFLPFIGPTLLNFLGLFFTLLSGWLFFKGSLIAAALIYEFGFLFDTWDGKLARLQGVANSWGGFLDHVIDSFRPSVLSFPLGVYFYLQTNDFWFIVLAGAYPVVISLYQDFCATGFVSNKGKQVTTLMGEQDSKSLLIRIKKVLQKYRLRAGYTSDETNTIVFLFCPILSAVFSDAAFVFWGFILGIALMVLLIIIFLYFQLGQLRKEMGR